MCAGQTARYASCPHLCRLLGLDDGDPSDWKHATASEGIEDDEVSDGGAGDDTYSTTDGLTDCLIRVSRAI